MARITRVAAVQAAPAAYDLDVSLNKVAELASQATAQGAHLVVFPEAFLSAYPRHLDFSVGSRSTEHREWYARYVRVSKRPRITAELVSRPSAYPRASRGRPGKSYPLLSTPSTAWDESLQNIK